MRVDNGYCDPPQGDRGAPKACTCPVEPFDAALLAERGGRAASCWVAADDGLIYDVTTWSGRPGGLASTSICGTDASASVPASAVDDASGNVDAVRVGYLTTAGLTTGELEELEGYDAGRTPPAPLASPVPAAPAALVEACAFIYRDEVAEHNTADDCWIVIGEYVYDVGDWFAGSHPGGDQSSYCGKDATAAFNAVGSHSGAIPKDDRFRIGQTNHALCPCVWNEVGASCQGPLAEYCANGVIPTAICADLQAGKFDSVTAWFRAEASPSFGTDASVHGGCPPAPQYPIAQARTISRPCALACAASFANWAPCFATDTGLENCEGYKSCTVLVF